MNSCILSQNHDFSTKLWFFYLKFFIYTKDIIFEKINKNIMEKFTEKMEYKEATSLRDQGELATRLMDVQSFIENSIIKTYDKKDINSEILEQITKKIDEATELIKSIFK